MKSINESIQRLLVAGVLSNDTMFGCDELTISKIEETHSIQFPHAYRQFLTQVGSKAGMFMEGSDYSCDKLLTINADAVELLAESDSDYTLQKTDFVFLMNQGYEFLFINVDTTQQASKVYRYEEGDKLPQEVAFSFEEWFDSACNDEIEAYEDLNR